jgi:hypothetical protein
MSDETLQAVMEPVMEHEWYEPPRAVAIFAPDARTFADANLTRAHLGGSTSRRRVFVSREVALVWLDEQRRSG